MQREALPVHHRDGGGLGLLAGKVDVGLVLALQGRMRHSPPVKDAASQPLPLPPHRVSGHS